MNLNLVRAIVEALVFFETSDDDAVNPDEAVKAMESIAYFLQKIAGKDRADFIESLHRIAAEETDTGRKSFIELIPEYFGLENEDQ